MQDVPRACWWEGRSPGKEPRSSSPGSARAVHPPACCVLEAASQEQSQPLQPPEAVGRDLCSLPRAGFINHPALPPTPGSLASLGSPLFFPLACRMARSKVQSWSEASWRASFFLPCLRAPKRRAATAAQLGRPWRGPDAPAWLDWFWLSLKKWRPCVLLLHSGRLCPAGSRRRDVLLGDAEAAGCGL